MDLWYHFIINYSYYVFYLLNNYSLLILKIISYVSFMKSWQAIKSMDVAQHEFLVLYHYYMIFMIYEAC